MDADDPWFDSEVTATVLDTVTGRTATQGGRSPYAWVDGDWSCDCNRGDLFGPSGADWPEGRRGGPRGLCAGNSRFLVVAACGDFEGLTLREINGSYPAELLDRFLPPPA